MKKQKNRNRKKSVVFLANNIGCSPDQLKSAVFDQLSSMNPTKEILTELLDNHKNTKLEQAEEQKIHPDDTPAAIMIGLISDYQDTLTFENKISDEEAFLEREISEAEAYMEMKERRVNSLSDSLADIVMNKMENNDEDLRSVVESFAEKDPELIDSFMKTIMYADNPGKEIIDIAIDIMVNNENFESAKELLYKGLQYNNKQNEPQIYDLLSQCYDELNYKSKRIEYLEKAIASLKANTPDDYPFLCGLYLDLFSIYRENGDNEKALETINLVQSNAKLITNISDMHLFLSKFYDERSKFHDHIGEHGLAIEDAKQATIHNAEFNKHDEGGSLF